MSEELLERFHAQMLNIYHRAKDEANYTASRFFHMVGENGGFESARILINANTVSEGYTGLWERGRLDLTVEALILENPEYHPLFTVEELNICQQRLAEYKYDVS